MPVSEVLTRMAKATAVKIVDQTVSTAKLVQGTEDSSFETYTQNFPKLTGSNLQKGNKVMATVNSTLQKS